VDALTLAVCLVEPQGLVAAWNAAHPGCMIEPGHLIDLTLALLMYKWKVSIFFFWADVDNTGQFFQNQYIYINIHL
jgi:hypothetical protein